MGRLLTVRTRSPVAAAMREYCMPQALQETLRLTIEREIPDLRKITEDGSSARIDGHWSRKEELGHLLDSATNNRVRFARAALDGVFQGPSYEQNGWVRLHAYNDLPWTNLVEFWYRYNSLLAHLIGQIPEDRLDAECIIGPHPPATLRFVIEDYVAHMQHHLDHILQRTVIAPYPRA